MEDNKNLVEVKNLEVSFFTYAGEVKAVRGISYNLKPGEVMGIVGESGSGKSVSSYGLMGIIPEPGKVIGGQILFEGRDVTAMSEKELLKIRGKDISMIFQDPMTSLIHHHRQSMGDACKAPPRSGQDKHQSRRR